MDEFFTKISDLIDGQVPEWVRAEHPLFIDFLEAYYEWMEEQDQATWAIHKNSDFVDIDHTLEQFIEQFRSKFLTDIPQNVLADKRLLAKNIKDFYAARGSEKSYKFLFRIMYDEDVDFYYPKEDILRASDGKWVEDVKIFVKKIDDDPYLFENLEIVGLTSGATGIVDVVQLVNKGPFNVYQMFIREYSGSFGITETVQAEVAPGEFITVEICGIVESFDVIDGGKGYQVGDIVPVIDATNNGVDGLGRVGSVKDTGAITSVDVLAPGTGYRVGDPVIFDETVTDGFGAVAKVSAVSPDNVLNVDNTIIGDSQNVRVIDFYPPEADTINNVRIIDYLNFEIVELGGILAIEVIEGGENYDILPDAFVGQQVPNLNLPPGVDAQVQPRSDSEGVIQRIDVVDPGAGYIEHPLWPQADLTLTGDGTAVANVNVGGGPFKTLGYWLNDDGHLSSKKFLQDGDFYQYYSYQLKVDLSLNTYRDIVKEIVHPAGMKMFGLVAIETPIDTRARIPGEELPLHFTEYRIDIHPLMETPVEYELEKGYSKVIKPSPFKLIQFPIFIFPYEDEIIEGYDHIVLEDFVGFTQEKSDFNRQAVVDITVELPNTLDGILPSCVADLDAALLESYTGTGQDWINGINMAPATDFNMVFGDTNVPETTDPVFVGLPGDPGAYFELQNTDLDVGNNADHWFTMGTNPPLVSNMHNETGDWWMALAFRPEFTTGQLCCPLSTGGSGNPGDEGLEILIAENGSVFPFNTRINVVRNGVRVNIDFATSPWTGGVDYLMIVSYDSTNDQLNVRLNGATGDTSSDVNVETAILPAFNNLVVGRRAFNPSTYMGGGTRIYNLSFGTEYLTDLQAQDIINALNTRHGRVYA